MIEVEPPSTHIAESSPKLQLSPMLNGADLAAAPDVFAADRQLTH